MAGAWERGQGERGGEGPGRERRGARPRRPSSGRLPAPALVQARRHACRLTGPRRRPATPIGAERASGGGPGMGEERAKAALLLGRSRIAFSWAGAEFRLLHWPRPGGVPTATASPSLGGDRRPPPAPGERPVTVRPADGDRSCYRHSNSIAGDSGERKRKREKEREGEEGRDGRSPTAEQARGEASGDPDRRQERPWFG